MQYPSMLCACFRIKSACSLVFIIIRRAAVIKVTYALHTSEIVNYVLRNNNLRFLRLSRHRRSLLSR